MAIAELDRGTVTYEKIHGAYEQRPFMSSELIAMSQVRGGRNPVSAELRESICSVGLLNPIDVAIASPDVMAEYIDFVNTVWRRDRVTPADYVRGIDACESPKPKLEDFAEYQLADGAYPLIIAGHSRFNAIRDAERLGRLDEYPIMSKVHDVASAEEIIQLQLAENTYSQPSKERYAIAVVEAYTWGLNKGKWNNPTEFAANPGMRAKPRFVRDALAFQSLPPDLVDYILRGVMSFSAGVALGRSQKTIREYAASKLNYHDRYKRIEQDYQAGNLLETEFFDQRQALSSQLETAVVRRLHIMATRVVSSKMSGPNAAAHIRANCAAMQEEMDSANSSGDVELEGFGAFDLGDPSEQWGKDEKRKYEETMRQLAGTPSRVAVQILGFNEDLLGGEKYNKLVEAMRDDIESASRSMAKRAFESAARDVIFE